MFTKFLSLIPKTLLSRIDIKIFVYSFLSTTFAPKILNRKIIPFTFTCNVLLLWQRILLLQATPLNANVDRTFTRKSKRNYRTSYSGLAAASNRGSNAATSSLRTFTLTLSYKRRAQLALSKSFHSNPDT